MCSCPLLSINGHGQGALHSEVSTGIENRKRKNYPEQVHHSNFANTWGSDAFTVSHDLLATHGAANGNLSQRKRSSSLGRWVVEASRHLHWSKAAESEGKSRWGMSRWSCVRWEFLEGLQTRYGARAFWVVGRKMHRALCFDLALI